MFLWVATVLSLLAAVLHIFVGTAEVRGPLLEAGIAPLAEQQLLMVWHMISVVLLWITGTFFDAAYRGRRAQAEAAVFVSLALGAVSLVAALTGPLGLFGLPQWVLLFAMGLTGAIGMRR